MRIARDKAKCRSRFGAARMFSERCAPAAARRIFSLANSSSAWGPLELPRASWNILERPQGLVDPPGASWDSLGLPETSLGFLKPPGTSCGFLEPPEASWGFLGSPGASYNFLGPPEASWGLLRLPGASWCILGSC